MAQLIVNNIEATAKQNPELFYNALQGSNTIKNDYFRVLPKVKADSVLVNKLTVDTGLSQADGRDCAWDPTKAATLDAKEVELGKFKINGEQCIEALDSFLSQAQYDAFKLGELPGSVEDVLMDRIAKSVGLDIEKYIWTATKAADGVDGIITKATADSDVIDVAGTTLTAANVLDEIVKVYDAIPQAVLDEQYSSPENAKVRIFVSPKTYRFVRQALATTPTAQNVTMPSFTVDNGSIYYLGVEIAVAQGMADDKMLAAAKQNLVFVTDLMSEANIEGEQGKTLKDKSIFYVRANYRLASDYVFGGEIVLYA